MSKFLKLIFYLILVAALLVAAAILVPQFANIRTVVIDSQTLNTNLPYGSVSYTESADATTLVNGDVILLEDDGEVAYKVADASDASAGVFKVLNASDKTGATENMALSDTVTRIVYTVPLIGYAVIATRSTEGLIVLGLILLFEIVLFILAELWKKNDDEEDEEAEEDAEPQAKDERFSIEDESVPSAETPELPVEETDDDLVANAAGEEEMIRIDPDELFGAEPAGDEDDDETPEVPAESIDTLEIEEVPDENALLFGAEPEDGNEDDTYTEKETYEDGPDAENAEDAVTVSEFLGEDAEAPINETPADEAPAEETPALAEEPLAVSAEEKAEGSKITLADIDADMAKYAGPAAAAEGIAAGGAEEAAAAEDAADEALQEAAAAAEEVPAADDLSIEGTAPEDPDSFLPVNRPTLVELMEQAKKQGDSPKVKKDENTGVTVLDYSDLI